MNRELSVCPGGTEQMNEVSRHCHLTKLVRDSSGQVRFHETPEIVREIENLGRRMILVRFEDGSTTFLFPDEVVRD